MLTSLVAFFFLLTIAFNTQTGTAGSSLIHHTKQLVIVISPDDSSSTATLYRFDKKGKNWNQTGHAYPVNLGWKGLAWGRGLHKPQPGTQKQEGDGKSPAGIFRFGTAFGYAPVGEVALKMDYLKLSKEQVCVEDTNSLFYNQIIDETKVAKDWNSNEAMRREDWLYQWGLMIEHNTPARANSGSCIFFHLWRKEGSPTLGCTAMSKENMLILLKWLDRSKQPLLVQLVEKDYDRFQQQYGLPRWAGK
ncbi:MAG: hypothetical protein H6577_25005 [Lewinellaceae bacterium]|nr:hypothetical protein [Saprospiraceae bacterium]MCB9341397.1 hypothetical protein [Lewinellaceae bacterium]